MLLKGTWMRRGREDGRMLLKIPGGGGWRRRKEGRMLLKDTWMRRRREEGRMLLKDTWTRRRREEGRGGCY